MSALHFRHARVEDIACLQVIRRAAFAPIFASFRSILGDEIYELAQRREDEAQEELLTSLITADSGWTLYVAQSGDEVVGFVAVQLNPETHVGESGLNAVDPRHAGKGIGTAMYEFAVARMKQAGMKVATVATGGDPSHAPARRAYQKAGFVTSRCLAPLQIASLIAPCFPWPPPSSRSPCWCGPFLSTGMV